VDIAFLEQIAKIFNLNEKDTMVYLDLLKFGSSAASTISARTNIDRTTVYSVLKRLCKRGIVVEAPDRDKSLFLALDPNVFTSKIQSEIHRKQDELKMIESVIPDLRKLQNQFSGVPIFQIFQGEEAVISLYDQMVEKGTQQDAILTLQKLPSNIKRYLMKDYIDKKLKRKLSSRVLIEDSSRAKKYKVLDYKSNRKTKLVPEGVHKFETEIIITDTDEVAMIDFQKDIVGVLIKSSTIHSTIKAVFDLVWKTF
jgi:sugar-specific transcriptional regulator TrmB